MTAAEEIRLLIFNWKKMIEENCQLEKDAVRGGDYHVAQMWVSRRNQLGECIKQLDEVYKTHKHETER